MATSTSDPTARFFAGLAGRGEEPLLRKASGSTLFEIRDGRRTQSWLVAVEAGKLTVTKGGGAADCVIRANKDVLDKIVTGRLNGVAAVLRGDVHVEGDWRLLVLVQRLFPGPRRRRRGS